MLERGLRGCRLIDQANEMFRVLPIALTRDGIGAIRAFRQTLVAFVILSPLAEAVGRCLRRRGGDRTCVRRTRAPPLGGAIALV